jgi:hypothetical protein
MNLKRAEAACTVLTYFQTESESSGCCMLCKRAFGSREELGEFLGI